MKMAKRIAVYAGVTLATFLVGVSATRYVSIRHQAPRTPWEVLLKFQNQELKILPDDSRHILQKAIDATIGPPNSNEFPFSPRMFRTMWNITGQRRYVLVEERPLMTIPGESRLRMYVFDAIGRLLTAEEFSGGWRTHVAGMNVERNPLLQQDALVVKGQFWVGDHRSYQYYVIVGDRIVPAYFEQDGELKRNEYLQANISIAPSIP
jgi:hypothetical protein